MILLRQIRNEALHNTWLLLELFIVGCVMWHVVDEIYIAYQIHNEPVGVDIEDVYRIETHFDASKADSTCRRDACFALQQKLKEIEGVEYASASFCAQPYIASNWTTGVDYEGFSGEMAVRCVSPEFMQVFRIGENNGQNPDSLANYLEQCKLVITTHWLSDSLRYGDALVGQTLRATYANEVQCTVGACLPHRIKPHRWAYASPDAVYANISKLGIAYIQPEAMIEICVRALPGQGGQMRQNVMEQAATTLAVDGLTIVEAVPLELYRNSIEDQSNTDYQLGFIFCAFMLFCIFLGILGTFWHRTLERRSQIAIMRALGVSRRGIFLRTNAEALILLLIAFAFSITACYISTYYGVGRVFPEPAFGFHRFSTTQLITFGLMSTAIVLACILPAMVAYRTPIAVAIREE